MASSSTSYIPPHPPEQSKGNRRKILVAIVLVALAVLGVAGYFLYDGVARANRLANDKTGAYNAETGIVITCSSNNYNTSSLPSNVTLGVSNPSGYSADATWLLTIVYQHSDVSLFSWQSFHIPSRGFAYPGWEYTMTQQMISSYDTTSNKNYTMSLYEKDAIHGAYGDYNFTWWDTYNSVNHLSLTQRLSQLGRLPNC